MKLFVFVFSVKFYQTAILALGVVLLLVIWQLFRLHRRNRMLHQQHQELHEELQLRQQEEAQEEVQDETQDEMQDHKQPQALPEEKPSANQQLYQKICQVMEEQRLYMQTEMNREKLASILGTNYKYVADAIRECSDDKTVNQFINGYRIRYAAQLLAGGEYDITTIIYKAGFNNRSNFNKIFREYYQVSPGEYRKAANANSQG